MTPSPTGRQSHTTSTRTRLTGTPLWMARAAGLLAVILVVGVFVMTAPVRYIQLASIAAESQLALRQLGLSNGFLPLYITTLDTLALLTGVVISAVLFVRRPDDRMALLTGLVLVFTTILLIRPPDALAAVGPFALFWVTLVRALGAITSALFTALYPTGRWYPRWTRYVVWALILWFLLWPLFPNDPINPDTWPTATWAAAMLPLYGFLVTWQVARYVRVSGPTQRQQTKWIVLGLVGVIGGAVVFIGSAVVFPMLAEPGVPRILYIVFGVPFLYLCEIMLPLTVAFSVMRYRLWDIDFYINRSLTYGVLTALLVAAFGGVIFLIEIATRAITGQAGPSVVALAGAMLVIGAIFQPARTRLRRFVDRRIYGIELDYKKALKAYADQDRRARERETQTSIGPYRDLQLLGRGGMGEIYLGRDPQAGRPVAIKLLAPSGPTTRRP